MAFDLALRIRSALQIQLLYRAFIESICSSMVFMSSLLLASRRWSIRS